MIQTNKDQIESLLISTFNNKYTTAMLRHYDEAVRKYLTENWETALFKIGKFVEAVLKNLSVYVGETPPKERGFKADNIINKLSGLPSSRFDDSIRLTIPRACRFIYDIASNRGGRHDSGEISPNEMDVDVSIPICSWIIAEMIRLSQKGVMDIDEAKKLVESLIARKYPFIEDIDGRRYFNFKDASATEIAFIALVYQHPRRLARKELIETLKLNGFKERNAYLAVERIRPFVDNDESNNLLLRAPGLRKAEELMKKLAK